jgi:acyl phosphate:glycerol-3-phosphate acyltransferase
MEMNMLLLIAALVSYFIGSIPFGFILVKMFTGRDVRQHGSGRTGGTNAWRAAGKLPGLLTALLDGLKCSAAIWTAQVVLPEDTRYLGMAMTGLAVILGHNHSIFMHFKGGAGGAPCVGGVLGLWPPALLIILPIGVFVWLGIGYASLATLSVSVVTTIIFAYRAFILQAPSAHPEFVLYGLGSCILIAWALRPNLQRLLRGEEKKFNWREAGRDKSPSSSSS